MLKPMVCVLDEYKTLVANMDACDSELAKKNLALLCSFETLLSLPVMILLLGSVNALIKFAQGRHVYICDFVSAVKVCQGELYTRFVDPETAFSESCFGEMHRIIGDRTTAVEFGWFPDLETHGTYLSMHVLGEKFNCHQMVGGRTVPVDQEVFEDIVQKVKSNAKEAAVQLIDESDA
jgi:hypothetical protein